MMVGSAKRDDTLQDPRCVFQIIRRHYARYTPEMVQEVCGVSPELFAKVAETLCRNSGRERTPQLQRYSPDLARCRIFCCCR